MDKKITKEALLLLQDLIPLCNNRDAYMWDVADWGLGNIEKPDPENYKNEPMIDYGAKTLSDLLDHVKNMSVDEYNSAYEEALKDIAEFISIKVTSERRNERQPGGLQVGVKAKKKE